MYSLTQEAIINFYIGRKNGQCAEFYRANTDTNFRFFYFFFKEQYISKQKCYQIWMGPVSYDVSTIQLVVNFKHINIYV